MKDAPSARRLAGLHAETDRRFSTSTSSLDAPIACGSGCFSCCVDDLTVWEVEATRIREWASARAIQLKIGPTGACAMLRDGRCQVYEARPYVCRSQGAVLRFWDGEAEAFDTCPEHLQAVNLSQLQDRAYFDLGPAEQELASIASAALGEEGGRGLPQRVGLRDLAKEIVAQGPTGSANSSGA